MENLISFLMEFLFGDGECIYAIWSEIIGALGAIGGGLAGKAEPTGLTAVQQFQLEEARQKQRESEFARQLGLTREQFEEQKRVQRAREEAYGGMLGRAGEFQRAGEAEFMGEMGAAVPELEQARQDILSGEAEALQRGAGQMRAGFSQMGLRGGQAATQLRRGIGEMGIGAARDINVMALQEAQQRQAMRAAYQRQKAMAGQTAIQRPGGF
jgi:hypothetical protein